jgi:hypothetical protein
MDVEPFSPNILALALYLRFTHAISYKRLSRKKRVALQRKCTGF